MQGALWSETVRTSDELDSMIFPRLLALAERAWHKAAFEEAANVTSDDEWKSFARAVGEREFARLEKIGVAGRFTNAPTWRVTKKKMNCGYITESVLSAKDEFWTTGTLSRNDNSASRWPCNWTLTCLSAAVSINSLRL
ncbi:hypothetical protein DPMN_082655 [Dreissena polymorpha]|uniref:beta-N-acetylhexosaminidase n=1 Tax=Dreissena polymorpha TaxID=45954 RepID=A0A9D4BHN7_DREPO|nr:hypothetical protein DPMN_082655 [Dreissena polymorpha]